MQWSSPDSTAIAFSLLSWNPLGKKAQASPIVQSKT
jgi:hypothetical protein